MSAGDELLIAVADGVATFTFNRPAARNALSAGLRSAFVAAVSAADADPSVAVLVLTGVDPAFSSGVDLKELSNGYYPPEPVNPAAAVRALAKPVIAAVNGACVTGGLEIALSCDFIVASERAFFADTHARYGLVAGWGLTALLPAAVGVRQATELSLTGRRVTAEEAVRLGFVNRVVSHERLLDEVNTVASQLTKVDVHAATATLRLYRSLRHDVEGPGLVRERIFKSAESTNFDHVAQGWQAQPRHSTDS
jgi:enoyl-CoA hydratase